MKTIDTVKKLAKKIKKEKGIKHHTALDLAAQERGFSNYRQLINEIEKNSKSEGSDRGTCFDSNKFFIVVTNKCYGDDIGNK